MARRRRRAATKRRTRRSTGYNVKQAAFALGTAQIAMKGIAGVGLWDFFTAGTQFNTSMNAAGWSQSGDPHLQQITLQEIIKGGQRSEGVFNASIADGIVKNVMSNAVPMILSIGGLKVADKLLTKAGVWRNTNKMLDAVGVKSIVRV